MERSKQTRGLTDALSAPGGLKALCFTILKFKNKHFNQTVNNCDPCGDKECLILGKEHHIKRKAYTKLKPQR